MTTPFRLHATAFLIHSQLHVISRGRPLSLHVTMRHSVVTEADSPLKNGAHNVTINLLAPELFFLILAHPVYTM